MSAAKPTPELLRIAARIAAETWGGRWVFVIGEDAVKPPQDRIRAGKARSSE